MSPIDSSSRVGLLVAERPSRSRVLERHGIDFCCGGGTRLGEACERLGLDPAEVARELEAAEALHAMRNLARGFVAPQEACRSWIALRGPRGAGIRHAPPRAQGEHRPLPPRAGASGKGRLGRARPL